MSKCEYIYNYSETYEDEKYYYRIVTVKSKSNDHLPYEFRNKILPEKIWREKLGVQQSLGWEHFMLWSSDPSNLIFRKPKSQS